MNKPTKLILETLSNITYSDATAFKFDKNKRYSERYKKGRLVVYEWVNELCYDTLQKEKKILLEFISVIESKQDELKVLKEGDYKNGVHDSFKEVLSMIEGLVKK